MIQRFTLFFVVLMIVPMMQAEVRLPAIFGSNMVLQRDQPVPVWGFAADQETVAVEISGQRKETVADGNGTWSIMLDPLSVGGPHSMTVSGRNSIVFTNIMVGEVWICSGQSNMTFELKKSTGANEVIDASRNSSIRLFTVKRVMSDTLLNDVQGSWKESAPEVSGDFSAVAYFFGKKLYDSIQVPIGLVHVSWGGTAAEAWMPRYVLEQDSDFAPIIRRWIEDSLKYPAAIKEFNEKLPELMVQWNADSTRAVLLGRALPRKPTAPRGPGHRDTPCGQYNGMLHPIIPFAMRGVIWYQGEGNAARAHQYRRLFPALITTWRSLWKQGDFPFYYVQLPNLDRQPEPSKSGWAELREAQLMTLSVPNTGMAVTIDEGDPKDLHPANKQPVGERLALIALAKTYGRNIRFAAPLVKEIQFIGTAARVTFEVNEGKLKIPKGKKIEGFTIAGDDKKFLPANAEIRGAQIVVTHPKIKKPVAVRYAWADNPRCNLYSEAGLPVSPFRSDTWPEVTVGKK